MEIAVDDDLLPVVVEDQAGNSEVLMWVDDYHARGMIRAKQVKLAGRKRGGKNTMRLIVQNEIAFDHALPGKRAYSAHDYQAGQRLTFRQSVVPGKPGIHQHKNTATRFPELFGVRHPIAASA